jgi:RND family efflux transporter MFP subunit
MHVGEHLKRFHWWWLALVVIALLPLAIVLDRKEEEDSSRAVPEQPRPESRRTLGGPDSGGARGDWFERRSDDGVGSGNPAQVAALPPRGQPAVDATAEGAPVEPSVPQLDCVIEPHVVVAVGSPVEGILETLHVERSDFVEEGQVLAELDSDLERATVELARARAAMDGDLKARRAALEFGKRRQARADELFQQNAISLHVQDETETDAELAELQLEQARENKQLSHLELQRAVEALDMRTIQSPISGVVVERMMSPGELVDEEPILRVAQIDPLRVEVIVPAELFGSIAKGMVAEVMPEAPGDGAHQATVTIVDRVIDAASGTFGVQLELPNPDYALPGGLRCQVRFRAEDGAHAERDAGPETSASKEAQASDQASNPSQS